ncbi:MAG: hypothetical protein WCD69_22695 [Xanthobacteraceae bacterium]
MRRRFPGPRELDTVKAMPWMITASWRGNAGTVKGYRWPQN